jgi:hypothetical protein
MAPNINHTPLESNTARIPDGYLVIIGHNDQRYIVPEFMVPALHQMFEGYRKKDSLEVFTATGSVSGLSFSPGQQTCCPSHVTANAGIICRYISMPVYPDAGGYAMPVYMCA